MPQSFTPTPNALIDTLRAQLVQCAMRAVHRLPIALFDQIALPAPVHVVDQHDVDRIRLKALQAVLDRAQRAVVAVIECDLEWRRTAAQALRSCATDRLHQPADLGRKYERAAIDGAQARAEAMLGETEPVERRGVEIAQARGVEVCERGSDRSVRIVRREAAERRGAHAELRNGDVAAADRPRESGIEAHVVFWARRLAMLCT